MSARHGSRVPLPKVPKVLQRVGDGKFLELWGWGIEWAEKQSAACPKFTTSNMGKQRQDDFHKNLYQRFSSRKAKQAGVFCKLVPYDESNG
jgi:hypothetical protein